MFVQALSFFLENYQKDRRICEFSSIFLTFARNFYETVYY